MSFLAISLAFLFGVNCGLWLQRRFGAPKLVVEQILIKREVPDRNSKALQAAVDSVCSGLQMVGDDPHWLVSHTVQLTMHDGRDLWLIVRNREFVK